MWRDAATVLPQSAGFPRGNALFFNKFFENFRFRCSQLPLLAFESHRIAQHVVSRETGARPGQVSEPAEHLPINSS
jgi:hypothetical protein